MSPKDQIYPLAYELDSLEVSYFQLRVPQAWWQAARNLTDLASRKGKQWSRDHQSIPVTALNQFMAAILPDCLVTIRGAWAVPGKVWLQSLDAPDPELIAAQVRAWFYEQFAEDAGNQAVQSEVESLADSDWQWEEGGPKNLLDAEYRFSAIPQYIARQWPDEPVIIGGRPVQFVRYHGLTDGAELVSWPPTDIPTGVTKDGEVRMGYASLVIRISARTIPWRKDPLIYVSLGLRRWMDHPLKGLKHHTGVYVAAPWRWLDGKSQRLSLIKLPVKNNGRDVKWPRALSALVREKVALPEPLDVARDPLAFLSAQQFHRDVRWAVAYDNRYPFHRVSAGVGRRDVADLYTLIAEQLGDLLRPAGTAERVQPIRPRVFWGFKRPQGSQEPLVPMQRADFAVPAFFSPHRPPIQRLAVFWETPATRDAILAEIESRLSLTQSSYLGVYSGPNGDRIEIVEEEIDVSLRGGISPGEGNGKYTKKEAVEERAQRIARHPWVSNEQVSGLAGAIIEIPHRDNFKEGRLIDPKSAWRVGAARAGYVNQHIHAVLDESGNSDLGRVRSAVSDLMRQLGIYHSPVITEEMDGLGPERWLLAFAIIRRTRKTSASSIALKMAIIVRINCLTGTVEATTPPLWQSQRPWRPYAEVLISLASTGSERNDLSEAFLTTFATDTIRDCLHTPVGASQAPKVLFLAEAQNARMGLTWLQDKNLLTPGQDLTTLEQRLSPEERCRVAIVRVRTAERCEVPTYRAGKGLLGTTKNLFRWLHATDPNGALYLSTSGMEASAIKYLKNPDSRLEHGRQSAWSNRALEIAVLHAGNESPDTIAYLVHRLRRRWPYINIDTTLPAPLQFAFKSKEYALGLAEEEDEVDVEETTDVAF